MNFIDLHCHTYCSDGELSPLELIDYALERDIQLLAITDHDNTDAYLQLSQHYHQLPSQAYFKTSRHITILSGVELSSRWLKQGIHIVGLGMDITHKAFAEFIHQQKDKRSQRNNYIVESLKSQGVTGLDDYLASSTNDDYFEIMGRKHFAEFLVQSSQVKNMSQAFKKYLSDDKLKDNATFWPSIETSIEMIHQAGGIAVLAHPLKYNLSRFKVKLLIQDFVEYQGQAIEVASSMQNQENIDFLYQQAVQYDLFASIGSDFHQSNIKWQELGRFNPLLTSVKPIWHQWNELASITSH